MNSNRSEKLKKLEEVLNTLKSEFVGLDEIIDQIGNLITPWYITPEIQERPTIISMWGMTGTGKTSVVRRLIDLLDLKSDTLTFDCGRESNNNDKNGFEDNLTEQMKDDNEIEKKSEYSSVFILDEFQHARTIDEDFKEIGNSSFRGVWELIDSGKVTIDTYKYDIQYLIGFIEDLDLFIQGHAGVGYKNGSLVGPEVLDVKEELSYYFDADEGRPISENDEGAEKNVEEKKDFPIIIGRVKRVITKCIDRRKGFGQGAKLVKELLSLNSTVDLMDRLKEVKKIISCPKVLNFSKSIVFIIGNLDEAFVNVIGDTNPDIDADIFYELTKDVSITDIKRALSRRFRDEQIARFGNNIIKYPTLTKDSFRKIIKNEVKRVTDRFESISGKKVVCTNSILDLLYFEGVYPIQGVRPVLSTVSSLLSPIMSSIIVNTENYSEGTVIKLDTKTSDFNSEKVVVIGTIDGNVIFEREVKLTLGELRNPKKRKTRFINAVHEIGHAIALSYTTGILPKSIMSISSMGGGVCITHNSEDVGEIISIEKLEDSVICSLSGYLAERLIYPTNKCLLGSESDIRSAWTDLSYSAYRLGYLGEPIPYSNEVVESLSIGISNGASDTRPTPINFGGGDNAKSNLINIYRKLITRARDILKDEKSLLINGAITLGNKGTLTESEFLDLVDTYGKNINRKKLEEIKNKKSYDYYEKELLNSLEKLSSK